MSDIPNNNDAKYPKNPHVRRLMCQYFFFFFLTNLESRHSLSIAPYAQCFFFYWNRDGQGQYVHPWKNISQEKCLFYGSPHLIT